MAARPAHLRQSSDGLACAHPGSSRFSLCWWGSPFNQRWALCYLPKRPGLKPGDQVRNLQGPFAGHLGLYAGMRAHERALVLLALLGGQQRVELPKADVEAVSNTGRTE